MWTERLGRFSGAIRIGDSTACELLSRRKKNRGSIEDLIDVLLQNEPALPFQRSVDDFDLRTIVVGRNHIDRCLIVDLLGRHVLLNGTYHPGNTTLLRSVRYFHQRVFVRIEWDRAFTPGGN